LTAFHINPISNPHENNRESNTSTISSVIFDQNKFVEPDNVQKNNESAYNNPQVDSAMNVNNESKIYESCVEELKDEDDEEIKFDPNRIAIQASSET
ncbi:19001_t:CDS:2, partial [Entrophospora sp. SA101]